VKTIVHLPEQPPPFKRNACYEKPFCKKQPTNIGVLYIGFSARKTFHEETASAGDRGWGRIESEGHHNRLPPQPVVIKVSKEEQG
jgi:hypothetical protein